MKWITAGDIKGWFTTNRRHCEQTLPELIRRLIVATATVQHIDFPSGDSVTTPGWDGQLTTTSVSAFFPTGISGWEMGVGSPRTKAEADYTSRALNSLGLMKKDSTFVFVTPQQWPKRGVWEAAKKTAGDWKDVKVIAADMLESWLDSTPAVALWLARQIGKVTLGGIRDIEGVWEEWSLSTDPQMTTDLVIGGRKKDMEDIQNWIVGPPGLLEVQGDSPDEPLAFLYAVIVNLSESDRVKALSRCIVVENLQQMRECIQAFATPLIIATP